jgi:hypothetical protein
MKFLIWSFEHRAWWCPNEQGYTKTIGAAGVYSFERAAAICAQANCPAHLKDNPTILIEEAMVPIYGGIESLVDAGGVQ